MQKFSPTDVWQQCLLAILYARDNLWGVYNEVYQRGKESLEKFSSKIKQQRVGNNEYYWEHIKNNKKRVTFPIFHTNRNFYRAIECKPNPRPTNIYCGQLNNLTAIMRVVCVGGGGRRCFNLPFQKSRTPSSPTHQLTFGASHSPQLRPSRLLARVNGLILSKEVRVLNQVAAAHCNILIVL